MATDEAPLLDQWRQGDLSLAPIELPALILDGQEVAWQAVDAAHGVAILSQSCDIIKDVDRRPYVQVAALVPATDSEIAKAIQRETPSRIHLGCLADKGLLIDLDVTATVHKSVVAVWDRTVGCKTDEERRRIAGALARFRQRFAFPDSFNDVIQPIRKWVGSKRSKASPQGNFVRALLEVRVHCDDWENPTELTFLAIVDRIPNAPELAEWADAAKQLEKKAVHDSYPEAEFRIVTYDELSAREYLESDRLDWDGLSDAP